MKEIKQSFLEGKIGLEEAKMDLEFIGFHPERASHLVARWTNENMYL